MSIIDLQGTTMKKEDEGVKSDPGSSTLIHHFGNAGFKTLHIKEKYGRHIH